MSPLPEGNPATTLRCRITASPKGPQSSPLAFRKGRTRPAPRATPFPKVTELACRLPLSTLFHLTRGCSPRRPDAVMGTTMREEQVITMVFKGCNRLRDGGPGHTALRPLDHISGRTGSVASSRSDNKITCPRTIAPSHGSYALPPKLPQLTSQPNDNGFPFQRAVQQVHSLPGASPPFRIGSPVYHRGKHGTLPHVSLPGSHQYICYFHQDRH